MKYRGGWPRLVHRSADYARDSGTTTVRVKGNIYSALVLSTLLYGAEAWTTGEQSACLRNATYAFDPEDNLDGQSDKQGNTRTDRAAIYGRSSDQKESPVDWPPHEDTTRQATKAGSLLSTVFWSQKERAPSFPEGYHQEKFEAERYKNRFMDITLTAERYMESNSQVNGSRPTAW